VVAVAIAVHQTARASAAAASVSCEPPAGFRYPGSGVASVANRLTDAPDDDTSTGSSGAHAASTNARDMQTRDRRRITGGPLPSALSSTRADGRGTGQVPTTLTGRAGRRLDPGDDEDREQDQDHDHENPFDAHSADSA
jgi:hypothetical protein